MSDDDQTVKDPSASSGQEESIEETEEKDEELDEIEIVRQELEETEGKYKRALADYQNLQKRVTEEKVDWIRSSNKDLLLRLLPVLDTLMMAEKHLHDQGLAVCINQFLDTLKAEGVTRIKTVGETFDPVFMEAIVTDIGKENEVLEELRAGYMLNEKVLRPAQVKVGNGEK